MSDLDEAIRVVCCQFDRTCSLSEQERAVAANYFSRVLPMPQTSYLLLTIIEKSESFSENRQLLACSALNQFIDFHLKQTPVNLKLFNFLITHLHALLLKPHAWYDMVANLYLKIPFAMKSQSVAQLDSDVMSGLNSADNLDALFWGLKAAHILKTIYMVDMAENREFAEAAYFRLLQATSKFFNPEGVQNPTLARVYASMFSLFEYPVKTNLFVIFREPIPVRMALATLELYLLKNNSAIEDENHLQVVAQAVHLLFACSEHVQSFINGAEEMPEVVAQFREQLFVASIHMFLLAQCKALTLTPNSIESIGLHTELCGIVLNEFESLNMSDEVYANLFKIALAYCGYNDMESDYEENPLLYYDVAFCNTAPTYFDLRASAILLIRKMTESDIHQVIKLFKEYGKIDTTTMRLVAEIGPYCESSDAIDFVVHFIKAAIQKPMTSPMELATFLFMISSCYQFVEDHDAKSLLESLLKAQQSDCADPIRFTLVVEVVDKAIQHDVVASSFAPDQLGDSFLDDIDLCLNFAVFSCLGHMSAYLVNPKESIPKWVSGIMGLLESDEAAFTTADDSSEQDCDSYLSPISSCFASLIQNQAQYIPMDDIYQRFVYVHMARDPTNFRHMSELFAALCQVKSPVFVDCLKLYLRPDVPIIPYTYQAIVPIFEIFDTDPQFLQTSGLVQVLFQVFAQVFTSDDAGIEDLICSSDLLCSLILMEHRAPEVEALSKCLMERVMANIESFTKNRNVLEGTRIGCSLKVIVSFCWTYKIMELDPGIKAALRGFLSAGYILRKCDYTLHFKIIEKYIDARKDPELAEFSKMLHETAYDHLLSSKSGLSKEMQDILDRTEKIFRCPLLQ